MKYGFIGLGSQGAPMARRMIDAGLDVVLWARRAESLEPFAQTNATRADTVVELGAQVQHCGICVVDDAGVQEICEQLIPAMQPGSTIAIHSTIHPQLCRQLAEQAQAHGLLLVDAPVSGGGPAAAAGTLTVMVGGSHKAYECMKPVFETFSGLLIHLGDVGAGQTAKLVNNSMMAANMAIAFNSLEIAKSLNIDTTAFKELVSVSSGRSFAFDICGRLSQASDFAHGATMLNKDVRLLGETLSSTATLNQNDSNLQITKDEQDAYTALKATAQPFIDQALAEG